MKGEENTTLRTLIRLDFLLWRNDFQKRVNRLVYSFWRVYCSKTVRMRNKTKDRYCFMRSCFSEMVSLGKELMLISSKVCEALTLDSRPTSVLVYPVKEFYKLSTSLHIDKFTSEILQHMFIKLRGRKFMPYVNILKYNFHKILLKASLRNRIQISKGFDTLHCSFKSTWESVYSVEINLTSLVFLLQLVFTFYLSYYSIFKLERLFLIIC